MNLYYTHIKYSLGWLAALLTCFYKIPYLYNLWNNEHIRKKELIITNKYIIQTFSHVLYILHGVIINDMPILCIGLLNLANNIILYIRMNNKHDKILPMDIV